MDEKYLAELEVKASELEPSGDLLSRWLQETNTYATKFLLTRDEDDSFGSDFTVIEELEKWPFQEKGRSLAELIPVLQRSVDGPGVRPSAPRHLGYIPGGALYSSAIGDFIAAFTNNYAGVYFGSPGAVKMENILIRWMIGLIGYPESAFGNLPSGGSIANLIAVVCARDAKEINGEKVSKSCVYLTAQTHHCVLKALQIVGLAECKVRIVPTDDEFSMDTTALQKLILEDKTQGFNPFMIVGSCGTTDTGAVDDFAKISKIARAHDCWFHIDAAYGGFFILLDEMKARFAGIDQSDSIVMDPHKTLFLPYGSGAVLVKNGEQLIKSHMVGANYLQDAYNNNPEISPADVSPELTKHFRGLRMWLPLQLHGVEPFRAALTEKLELIKYFYVEVQQLGFTVGPRPHLTVCIYRYETGNVQKDNTLNMDLSVAIREQSPFFISTTTIEGKVWLRAAIVNFRTHLSHIKEYLRILSEKTKSVSNTKVKL